MSIISAGGSLQTDSEDWVSTALKQRGLLCVPSIRSTGLTSDEFCERLLLSQKSLRFPATLLVTVVKVLSAAATPLR